MSAADDVVNLEDAAEVDDSPNDVEDISPRDESCDDDVNDDRAVVSADVTYCSSSGDVAICDFDVSISVSIDVMSDDIDDVSADDDVTASSMVDTDGKS